jgi:hypothetical protein
VTFEQADLAELAGVEEIEIETRAASGAIHRTTIWAVVRGGVVYVRSVNGPGARWYREAIADPAVAIHVDGRRLASRAVRTVDQAAIAACSAGLRDKYRGSPSLRSMLAADILTTTLRLEPASGAAPDPSHHEEAVPQP